MFRYWRNNQKLRRKRVQLEEAYDHAALATIELVKNEQKLQEANTAKDKVFSIIAHDLRGPITSLRAVTELYQLKMLDQENIDELMEGISSQIDDTSNLLENILYWSRSQMKGFQVQSTTFDICRPINEIVSLYQSRAAAKGLILVSLLPDSPSSGFVQADSNIVHLILRNLIANAIKFTKAGGRVDISCKKEDKHLVISIRDNGIGMNKKQLAAARRGSLASRRGTANEKGSGIGLSLCFNLCQIMDSHLYVDSEEGRGTVFDLYIPAVRVDEKREEGARTERSIFNLA